MDWNCICCSSDIFNTVTLHYISYGHNNYCYNVSIISITGVIIVFYIMCYIIVLVSICYISGAFT